MSEVKPADPRSAVGDTSSEEGLRALLADVVESLSLLPRLPTSRGERLAAELIRDRLERLGCRAEVEDVPAYRSYQWPIGVLCGFAALAGLAARRRRLPAVIGGVALAGMADDITGGPMLARRLLMRARKAANVIAETGDPRGRRTLVVLVHHDAAPSGVVFGQQLERWFARRYPAAVERMTSNPSLWWPVLAGPGLVAFGGLLRRPVIRRTGIALSALSVAAMTDIGTRPAVPGANDNLSGVAAAVALAAVFQERPVAGLRVLLVSAGAEEALQQGMRGFAARHFGHLPVTSTSFLTLDAIGSGRLVLLEGEGPIRMHLYQEAFKDLVASCASESGVTVLRGLRSHSSTDGCVPSRHGYPNATIVSLDEAKLIPHYHQDSDLPEHLDYGSVVDAVRLAEAVARRLATTGS